MAKSYSFQLDEIHFMVSNVNAPILSFRSRSDFKRGNDSFFIWQQRYNVFDFIYSNGDEDEATHRQGIIQMKKLLFSTLSLSFSFHVSVSFYQ